MKKLFIYSGLLSGVISFVVWVGTFGMASEKQHVMLSKQMIQRHLMNMNAKVYKLKVYYSEYGELPEEIEFKDSRTNIYDWDREKGLSKQMTLGKDSIFIGLTPNYEESENYINFDCLLKSTLKHKPIIHNCKWSK